MADDVGFRAAERDGTTEIQGLSCDRSCIVHNSRPLLSIRGPTGRRDFERQLIVI